MILSIEGDEKTGKTTMAYTAPLKIVGFQFDMGAERALYGARFDRYFKGLRINIVTYPGPGKMPETTFEADITIFELPLPIQIDSIEVAGARELWDYFLVGLGAALRDTSVHSIVVDTMTLARRIKADAYLQGLQEKDKAKKERIRERLQEIEYGRPNDAIREIYTAAAGTRKNLIALHHLKDERAESIGADGKVVRQITGKKLLEGLNNTYRFVDVALRMKTNSATIQATIVSCGYSLDLKEFVLPETDWNTLMQIIGDTVGGRVQLELRE